MLDRLRRALAPPDPRETAQPGSGTRFTDLYPSRPPTLRPARYLPPGSQVAASLVSQLLAPANPARTSLTIRNASATADLYVTMGPWATAGNASWIIAAGGALVLPVEAPAVWRGDVSGVWLTVAGGDSARITETV